MLHPLIIFQVQEYYQNEPRFNGVSSRNNLPKKIKDGAYVMNLNEQQMQAHIGLLYFVTKVKLFNCEIFGVEHVPEEIKEFVGNKSIIANIFRVQASNSVMCGYFSKGFIDFMLAGKKFIDFTIMFSAYDFDKNEQVISNYFKDE